MKQFPKPLTEAAKHIRQLHQHRLELLELIRLAKHEEAKSLSQQTTAFFADDDLKLLERVEGDRVRSLKNLLLSHNSMYGLIAELGGMDPALSHHLTEKYGIIIEKKNSVQELSDLHQVLVEVYSNPANRGYLAFEDLSLVNKALYYVENNYTYDISIQDLASKLYTLGST